MPQQQNLFIAARIREPAVSQALTQAWEQALELMPPGNTRRETQPHITLRFLGKLPTDGQTITALMEKIRETADQHQALQAAPGCLHTFPGFLWACIQAQNPPGMTTHPLYQLQAAVNWAVRESGVPAEPEQFIPWIPHMTLGRFDPNHTPAVQEMVAGRNIPGNPGFLIDSLEILGNKRGGDYTTLGQPLTLHRSN